MVVLSVVFAEADETDLVATPLVESEATAKGATVRSAALGSDHILERGLELRLP
jgi:hypothetical protein